jgi:hypothetical protein
MTYAPLLFDVDVHQNCGNVLKLRRRPGGTP